MSQCVTHMLLEWSVTTAQQLQRAEYVSTQINTVVDTQMGIPWKKEINPNDSRIAPQNEN